MHKTKIFRKEKYVTKEERKNEGEQENVGGTQC